MTVDSTPKLLAALFVAVAVLAGCSTLGDFGDVVPSEASFEVTVRADGPGRLTLEEFQVDCSDVCTLDIPVGVVLHPQPVADPGGRFWYWGGACSGGGDCAVLVDSAVEIVAVFEVNGGDGTTAPEGDDQDDSGGTDDQGDAGGTGDDSGGTDDQNDDQATDAGPGTDGRYFLTFGATGPGNGRIDVPARDFVCTAECGLNGLPDEKVELEAIADEGSFFVGWTGACGDSGELCTVTMDEDDETMAHFRLDDRPLLLVVDPVPDGGTIRGGDIDCGDDSDDCSSDHASGETIELYAESFSDIEFAGWTGSCADSESPTCEFTIEEDAHVSALFEGEAPMYELTVDVEGNGDGDVIFPNGERCDQFDTCDQHFEVGSEVTLAANSVSGAYVDGWEGTDCDTHATTCTIRMDSNKSVTVSFHTSDLEFILRIEEPAGGTVVSDLLSCGDEGDNCQRDFAFDDEVRLQAIPSEGFEFAGWGGDCSDSKTPVCDLVFRDNKDVSASFRTE